MRFLAIFFLMFLLIGTLGAQAAPNLTGIVKDSNGKEISMHQYAAKIYCAKLGGYLPTLREYLEYARAHGAAGIRETKFPGYESHSPEIESEWNQLVNENPKNVWGRIDSAVGKVNGETIYGVDFYASVNGFDERDGNEVWTDTLNQTNWREGAYYYTIFQNKVWEPSIQSMPQSYTGLMKVRCVLN